MANPPRKLFSPYASSMFQDVPDAWKPFLLGENKSALIATLQKISKQMQRKYGVDSVYCGSDQYIYPHPANLFAAFFHNTPDSIRVIILGDYPRNNSGIAYAMDRFGKNTSGSYRREITAIQQLLQLTSFDPRGTCQNVLWLNYALTSNPLIVSNAQTVRGEHIPVAYALDPNSGWQVHNWTEYVNQVLVALLQAYPHIVLINWVGADVAHKLVLRGCSPGQPQFAHCDHFVQLSSMLAAQGMPRDPVTHSCVNWGQSAYPAVAAYAADGSCKGYRTANCITRAAVYTPQEYGGVANMVNCNWSVDVPAYEFCWSGKPNCDKTYHRIIPQSYTILPGCQFIYTTDVPATPTNNRGELLGLLRALDHAVAYYAARCSEAPMHLILDSTYAMGTAAEWCWGKRANDFAAVEKNRDMVRAVYLALNDLAAAMRCRGREMFCSEQTSKGPSATSVDMDVYFSRFVIYHQLSHLDKKGKVPRQGKNWIGNLPYNRWSANNEVDRLME